MDTWKDPQHRDEVHSHLVTVSGKLVLLDKLLVKLKSEGHKVLIYSQFTSLLDILEDYLEWKMYDFERIDGSTSLTARQHAIDRFSDSGNTECFVFMLSTRAGGVGINLIAADTVILFDSDWNPQNDIQAQSRCHRIGQTQKVSVYRLICRDTYEVYLFEKASRKLLLDDLVMAASTQKAVSTKESEDGLNAESTANPKGSAMAKNGRRISISEQKELEELLKRSAQKYLNPQFDAENDEKMKKFYSDDIDTILNENTVKIGDFEGGQSALHSHSVLSKAMFVPNRKRKKKKKKKSTVSTTPLQSVPIPTVNPMTVPIGIMNDEAPRPEAVPVNGVLPRGPPPTLSSTKTSTSTPTPTAAVTVTVESEEDEDDEEEEEEIRMDDPDFWTKLGFGTETDAQTAAQKEGEYESVAIGGKRRNRNNLQIVDGKRRRTKTNGFSNKMDRNLWEELGSDFDDLTDSDDEMDGNKQNGSGKNRDSDSDYDEVEDAKNHFSDDDSDGDMEPIDGLNPMDHTATLNSAVIDLVDITAPQRGRMPMTNINPSYLGRSTTTSTPSMRTPNINLIDDNASNPKTVHVISVDDEVKCFGFGMRFTLCFALYDFGFTVHSLH